MNNTKNSSQQDLMRQAMQFAQTPEGQQLMAMLQKNGGAELQEAIDKAAAGDYTKAKHSLSSLLSTPEAQAIIKQLGR